MRTPTLVALILSLVLVAAVACGDDDDDDLPTATQGGSATDTPSGDGAVVGVATIDAIGDVLVDRDGLTLYIFTNDTDGTSTCTGSCATTWLPLVTTAPEVTAPEGADGEFTLVEREGGEMQVVYEGQPLYRYAPDTTPGQANGEGIGGVWFAARTDPDAAAQPAGGADASLPEPDGGYYD